MVFIHSSVGGLTPQLGCLTSAATNMWREMSVVCCLTLFLVYAQGCNRIIVVWGLTILISVVVALSYFPTHSVQTHRHTYIHTHAHTHTYMHTHTSWPALVAVVFLMIASDWGKMASQRPFDLICTSCMAQVVEQSFMYLWPFVLLLLRTVCSIPLPLYLLDCSFAV
jgi:hypothetical protein